MNEAVVYGIGIPRDDVEVGVIKKAYGLKYLHLAETRKSSKKG